MSGLDGLGWPTDEPEAKPSRRYNCQICGRKGRRGNSISERMRTPICPVCTRNRPVEVEEYYGNDLQTMSNDLFTTNKQNIIEPLTETLT